MCEPLHTSLVSKKCKVAKNPVGIGNCLGVGHVGGEKSPAPVTRPEHKRRGKRTRVSAVLLAWRTERLLGLLIAGKRLHPEGQPRELFPDNPQLVLRAGFVEPVDQPDQRADMLLGQLKETLGGLGRHRTSGGRTATLGHDQPSLRTETQTTLHPAARFLSSGTADFRGANRE